MSTSDTHAKNRGSKMTAAEKKQAQMTANRKAQLQWYALGGFIAIAVIATIIIISLYTEGSIGGGHG